MARFISTTTRGLRSLLLLTPLSLALAGCGESSTEPGLDVALVVGTYSMTVLRFDPQGSLPESNILAQLTEAPQLNLTSARAAQIVYRDPVSTLVITIQGTFQTTPTGVRLDFASQSAYPQLMLSQRMEFTYSQQTSTLSFAADAPDGVSRGRLIELMPELATEQLLDPTPGFLSVTFTHNH